LAGGLGAVNQPRPSTTGYQSVGASRVGLMLWC